MVPSEERKPSARQAGSAVEEVTAMTYAGIEVTDADSAEAAADAMDEVELVDVLCPECDGARSICDLSYELGWITIECPCCGGWGTIEVTADGSDGWDDPEPPAAAAPVLAL